MGTLWTKRVGFSACYFLFLLIPVLCTLNMIWQNGGTKGYGLDGVGATECDFCWYTCKDKGQVQPDLFCSSSKKITSKYDVLVGTIER